MLGWEITDGALIAPAIARNRDAILEVLRRVLPASGTVLEIASGSGEHAVHFAAAFHGLTWRPSDPELTARRSIAAHTRASGLGNIPHPMHLDAVSDRWPIGHADAIVCINMIHIVPWGATEGLMAGAARILPNGGVLFLYGPFREGGRFEADSNAAFDAGLRERDPAWGVRDLEAVTTVARDCGLHLDSRIAMPANNLSVVYRKTNTPLAAD